MQKNRKQPFFSGTDDQMYPKSKLSKSKESKESKLLGLSEASARRDVAGYG